MKKIFYKEKKMGINWLLAIIAIFFVIIIGYANYYILNDNEKQIGIYNGSLYLETLNQFNHSNVGYGYDIGYNRTPLYHAKAYALFASAEAYRYFQTKNESALINAINSANWLIINSDLNDDGKRGWGLPFAWDAGGDNSITPAYTEYAIETAMGVQALLDVYDVAKQTRFNYLVSDYPLIAENAMDTFLQGKFDKTENGNVFWYSASPYDDFHVLNTCSMLAGQLQRLSQYPINNPMRCSEFADSSILYVMTHEHEDNNGNPFWMYYGDKLPESIKSNRPNDLQHEVYTLQGLFVYKKYGGKYGDSININKHLSTLNRFIEDDKVYEVPINYTYAEQWNSIVGKWVRVWGLGYTIHFSEEIESYLKSPHTLSSKLMKILEYNYKKNEKWLIRPDEKEMNFYPRQYAFILKGLAYSEYPDRLE